jgi:hypothetical protein
MRAGEGMILWVPSPVTRRLVRHHRRTIERVAAALAARGELTARQIDALARKG